MHSQPPTLSGRATRILRLLRSGASVLLVGNTQAGKSYFAVHVLLPRLQNAGLRAVYITGPMHAHRVRNAEVLIVDEVEITADNPLQQRIAPRHAVANWSRKYRRRVQGWSRALARSQVPAVYIVTRNSLRERRWIQRHVDRAEWDGRPVHVLRFETPAGS